MDLIYTNAAKEDQGVLFDYEFDLAFGADENDFECTVALESHCVEVGSFIYIEGTEYGGIVDSVKVDTEAHTVTYIGRTWHGILEGAVIEPESGYDYHVVTGEGNTVIAGLIEYLGLSSIFTASTEDSGIDVATYSFRYVDAYSGICKMLAKFDGKLKLKHLIDKVVLYAEPVLDYSNDDEWDSSQVDFVIQKNFRPTNHLVCLGGGNLRNRHVIHLFADENGGIQQCAQDDPVSDADYILDKSKQMLFGLDEVADVLDYPSAQVHENYVRLSEQPPDWARNYGNYFKQDSEDAFVSVEGVVSEDVTLLTAKPDDWEENYAAYHYYKDATTLCSAEALTTEEYRKQSKKPVDWETNYANYFVYWSDGLSEEYRAVSSVSKEKYVAQTIRPSNWVQTCTNYYKRKWGSGYERLSEWEEWKPRKYYTKTTYSVAPEWKGNRYYTMVKSTECPAWESGKYYTVKEVVLTPPFAPEIYFEKKLDHYAELVASGTERLKQAFNSNSISMDLDLDGVYDIGDIVGAVEHTTGVELWRPITKKIVTIKNGMVTISLSTDTPKTGSTVEAGGTVAGDVTYIGGGSDTPGGGQVIPGSVDIGLSIVDGKLCVTYTV